MGQTLVEGGSVSQQYITRQGLTVQWRDLTPFATWGCVGAAIGLTALATRVGRADRWGMLAAVAATALLAHHGHQPAAEADRAATERAEVAKLEELLEEATGAQVIPFDRGRARRPVS